MTKTITTKKEKIDGNKGVYAPSLSARISKTIITKKEKNDGNTGVNAPILSSVRYRKGTKNKKKIRRYQLFNVPISPTRVIER